jgi:hypothetical protein
MLHHQATVYVYPLLDCADEGSFAAVHESGFGTKRTWLGGLTTSAVEGRTDLPI